MVVLGIFIGYWFGKLILGGLFYTLFTENITPNGPEGMRIDALFSFLGAILGAILFASF